MSQEGGIYQNYNNVPFYYTRRRKGGKLTKLMERGKNPFEKVDLAEYVVDDFKESRAMTRKKKTKEDIEKDDDLLVTPIVKKKRTMKVKHPKCEEDQLPEASESGRASFGDQDSSEQNTVTFHNTKTYGKYLRARTDPEFHK